MYVYDPTMTKPLPGWTYAGFAFGLFVYQTLDAIDGKQARRTGSSSPLGQLFDHGCDALSASLLGVALIHTLGLGITLRAKIVIGTIWAPFYLAQLLEHHVGIVRTHVGNIGVTEGQLAQCGIMLASTILGADIWNTPIRDLLSVVGQGDLVPIEYQIKEIVIFVLAFNGVMYAVVLTFEMVTHINTISGKLACIFRILPVAMLIAFLCLIDENDKFSQDHAALLILGGGLLFTIVTTKLIISTMAQMPYNGFQLESFVFGFYFYAQYCLTGPDHDKNQAYGFILSMVLITGLYLKFVRVCILQITEHLGIY